MISYGDNVEAARSNYKESIIKENGVVGSRRMMMLNHFKNSLVFETNSINVQGGTRKLQGMTTLHVNEEQDNVGNLVPEEKDMAGYVAFSADYKGPRHHPPKNN
ncbi:hypothetical protein LIER_39281 [Lithospermum erythrorhizon]|uniref:Uncharacterized protein n=1 Tax=Lithospermum erythrorhizon TaxID=34254 RepID=A0AAV3QFH2_LITER